MTIWLKLQLSLPNGQNWVLKRSNNNLYCEIIAFTSFSSLTMTSCDINVIIFNVPYHIVIVDYYLKMCHENCKY